MEDHDDNYTDVDPPPPDDNPATIELGPGTEVGGYIIDGELGRGGMGVVYAATHPVIGKRAAIKVLRPSLSKQPIAVERFIQEARAVNQIGHPSIVDIFAFDRLPDGRAYLVMDLLVGESLRRRLRRGPLHLSEGVSVIDEVSSALIAAHDKGFVHRDLKPDNVYLVPREGRWPEVKLLDFGLAKLLQRGESVVQTKTGVLLGTPDYMSPEQARGKEIDHRTDIYALGVLTFEILTGKRPFPKGETPLQTLQAHAEKEPLSLGDEMPSLPQEIVQLAHAMLAKDPDHRPSLTAVRAVIKRLRSNTVIPTMSVASLEMSLPASLPKSSAAPSELSLTAVRLGAEPLVPSAQSLVESLPPPPSGESGQGLDERNSVPTQPGSSARGLAAQGSVAPGQSGNKWPTTVPGTVPGDLRPPSNPGIGTDDRRHPSHTPISNPSIADSDPRYVTQPPMSDPRRVSQPPISGPVVVDIRQGPSIEQPGTNPIDVRQLSQGPAGSGRFPSTVPGTPSTRSPTNPPMNSPRSQTNPPTNSPRSPTNPPSFSESGSIPPSSGSNPQLPGSNPPASGSNPQVSNSGSVPAISPHGSNPQVSNSGSVPAISPHGSNPPHRPNHGSAAIPIPSGVAMSGAAIPLPSAEGSQPPTALRAGNSPHASTTFGVAPPFKVTTSKRQPAVKPSRAWIAIVLAILLAAGITIALTQLV